MKSRRGGISWHVAGLAVLLVAGCEDAAQQTREQPVIVTVAPVGSQEIPRSISVIGTLAGFDELTLAPNIDGRVRSVYTDVGDLAVPGSVLLMLDPTDYQLAVAEAERALEAELARLGIRELPDGSFDVSEVPSVRKAQVALENAVVRAERVKGLFERRAASKDEFDLVATELKLAEATKEDAVTQALATLASARFRQASLETARQRLSDCALKAPVPAGWEAWAVVVGPGFTPLQYSVSEKMLTEGEMVRSMPVTNAFRLVIDHALKLKAGVPERHLADVRIGQLAEIKVDAYPGSSFVGKVARINPTIDPTSRTFRIEIAVPNLDGRLKAGGFARAKIQVRTDSNVTTVPTEALVTLAGVNKVFLYDADSGTARAVQVQLGKRDQTWVEVDADLPPDGQLIVSGLTRVVDGSPVQLREELPEQPD